MQKDEELPEEAVRVVAIVAASIFCSGKTNTFSSDDLMHLASKLEVYIKKGKVS